MEEFGGQNNASTAEDRTNYYSFGPSNLLKTLLWLDADRLEDLGRTMDQKKLDLQREVVRNERRQNTELQPYGEAYESLNGLLFPKGHPYHTSVIGSHEDLQNAQVQDVKDFFATYYVPNNASLVVSGDFNPKDIKPYIAQVFGTLPRRNDPPRKDLTPAKLTSIKRVTMTVGSRTRRRSWRGSVPPPTKRATPKCRWPRASSRGACRAASTNAWWWS